MRILILSIVAMVAFTGCVTESAIQYDRAWIATQEVLHENGLMARPSQYRDDTLIAVSQTHGDFLSKTRVKVVVRIEESEEGYYEPSVKVLNQIDLSDASGLTAARYQPNNHWVNTSNNAAMEAQLHNEILARMYGQNSYKGQAWKPISSSGNNPTYTNKNSESVETQATEFTQETW